MPKATRKARLLPVKQVVDRGMSLISRIRIRALLYTAGIVAATWAAILLTSVAWIPVVGVAVAAVAVSVNKATQVLRKPICLGCGTDLATQTATDYGIACPKCGSLNQRQPRV